MNSNSVIFLMGATATGKTDLAIEIAKRFPVEIISVDSALIYRQMDIGTAKPDRRTLAQYPHHLVDIIDPAESFSAWDFIREANRLINLIQARNRIPLLVGGTMMYFNALERGLNQLPKADAQVRLRLDEEASRIGWPAMHDRLRAVDQTTAERIKPGDSQRIQRALEVYEISGVPLSQLLTKETSGLAQRIVRIQLGMGDRSILHERINRRFQEMLKQGFVDEVVALKSRGDLSLAMPSMRCVGYRQIWCYLQGDINSTEMNAMAVAATRQLAKRQLTWLRKQADKNTFDCLNNPNDAIFKVLNESFS